MMNLLKLSISITLVALIYSCGNTKSGENSIFSFETSKYSKQYTLNDNISLEVLNPSSKNIDSIIYSVNDEMMGKVMSNAKFALDLRKFQFGYQLIRADVYFEGNNSTAAMRIEIISDVQPKLLKYKIVKTYTHDTESFTQGLEFYRDTLYESTGRNGHSYIRKYDYRTGKIYKQVTLDPSYFGEGITFVNGKIFQLTWKNKKGFIYNANTLELEKSFDYDKNIEGWGITSDGNVIYQSDGSEKLWKMNPSTQKMIGHINVYSGGTKISNLNELEWVNGKIYANVWKKDAIAVINHETGAVENIIDFSKLKPIKTDTDDVLNGIAYNKKTKTFFLTGKNWDTLFEVSIYE